MNYKIEYDGYYSSIVKTTESTNEFSGDIFTSLKEAKRVLNNQIRKNIKYLNQRVSEISKLKISDIENEDF